MTRKEQHEQSLANWDNEGGAMSFKREIPDANGRLQGSNDDRGRKAVDRSTFPMPWIRRDKMIQRSETPMHYVPVFIPVLLILALTAVTICRPEPANDGVLPKASIVCATPPC
jgi:hypothetical protein